MCDRLLQLNISFHLEIYIWWALFSKNNKIKSGKIYRHKSMHVSRSTKPLTNHSCQGWRSIYNSHKRFQNFSHNDISAKGASYAHRCTKPFAQRYKVKHILRQNSTMSINLFGVSTFYAVFGFWHTRNKRLIRSNNVNTNNKN